MSLAISWLVLAFGFWVATLVVPGVKVRGGFVDFMLVAALFGVLNFFVGWLVQLVVGVASLFILFFFSFLLRVVSNAVVLRFAAAMSSRLEVRSFGSALIASFVISLVAIGADQLAR